MQKMKLWALAAALFCGLQTVTAQTVRGTVTDAISGEPLVGAIVKITDSDVANKNTVTDKDGRYRIDVGQAGRYTIEASMVGYEPQRQIEVLVAGRNAATADFQLRELVLQLGKVTVRPVVNKGRALNPTAVAGAQMISVEEATRFAGTADDIARVVSRYTGATGSQQSDGVSTHGHPYGMTTYRMEGVEIMPPGHCYGLTEFGGGALSAIHTNQIANSDYFTGAAPAEYGNALGGVMDLQLRPGRNDGYEHSVKLSTLGLDLTSEGALSKKAGSSYIVGYRYGLTNLSNALGLGILDGDQAEYQDLTLKLNFPLSSTTTLSAWGHFSKSKDFMDWTDDYMETWDTWYDQSDFLDHMTRVMGGLTLSSALGRGWNLKAHVAAAWNEEDVDDRYAIYATDGTVLTTENLSTKTLAPATTFVHLDNRTTALTADVNLQKHFSAAWLLKTGASIRHLDYKQHLARAHSLYLPDNDLHTLADGDLTSEQVDAYATNNWRVGRWTLNAGLHLSGWTLAKDWTVQPRLSAEWRMADGHALALAYGLSSQTESLDTYIPSDNRSLKPMRSHQVVLDYRWQPRDGMKLSAEAWAEWQQKVAVSPTTYYTTLNRYRFYTADELTDKGRGRGYGLSVTAEQYMTRGFYWLLNASLYKNEYRTAQGQWLPTRLDRRWAVNATVGKEWTLRRGILGVNIAATTMGGLVVTPTLDAPSADLYQRGWLYAAYDESRPQSERRDPITDLSACVTYRIHGRHVDHQFGIDYLNILANEEPYEDYYNRRLSRVETITTCYSVPVISYTVIF